MKNNSYLMNGCVFTALILCGFALYHIPLHSASFYFDDRAAIVNNDAIKKIDLPKIFTAFNTRFLAGLSFALKLPMVRFTPCRLPAVNLLLHCLNAFLVYVLVIIPPPAYIRRGQAACILRVAVIFMPPHPNRDRQFHYPALCVDGEFFLPGVLDLLC